jgi:hypothetical protein
MSKVQTDNSYLEEKIMLRIASLPMKDDILVLEAFAGDGFIWGEVKKRVTKKNTVLRIDVKEDKKGVYLKGDNLKFMKSLDLNKFDIVDLDAYGSPFTQLKIVFEQNYKGIVHCTFIQTMFGALNKEMLLNLGYSEEMQKKIPSLFNKHGIDKLFCWLVRNGVNQTIGFHFNKKHYFYFVNS